jgi:hypothetical protein
MGLRTVPLMLLLDGALWALILTGAVDGIDGLAGVGLVAMLAVAFVRGRKGQRRLEASLQRRGYVPMSSDAITPWGSQVLAQRQFLQQLPTQELLLLVGEWGHSARVDLYEELTLRGVAIPPVKEAVAAARAARRPAEDGDDLVFAAPFNRVMAFVVDAGVLLGVQFSVLVVVTALLDRAAANVVSDVLHWPVFVGYWLLRDTIGGRSVGKRLLRLEVRDRSSHARCAFRQAVLRNVPLFVPLDWFFVFWDGHSRFGDRLADTMVVARRSGTID